MKYFVMRCSCIMLLILSIVNVQAVADSGYQHFFLRMMLSIGLGAAGIVLGLVSELMDPARDPEEEVRH